MTEPATEPEQLVREYFDVWNEKDEDRLPDLISPTHVMKDPPLRGRDDIPGPDGEAHGIDGITAFWDDREWAEWEISPRAIASDGNQVLVEADISGTYAPIETEVEYRVMTIFAIEAGKIEEQRVYFDMLEVGEKLGYSVSWE